MLSSDDSRTRPAARREEVTLANWRSSPYSAWAFQNVRELIPTAAIANAAASPPLPESPQDLDALEAPLPGGGAVTVADMIETTDTDGFLVLHDGRLVYERYRNGMDAAAQHILMSVSKSVTGLLAGILQDEGRLDPDALVTGILPELSGTAWEGARIRHVLDMRTGIAFEEDYLATGGPIIRYRRATGWNPPVTGDLRSFLSGMNEKREAHGGAFRYIPPNSDLLGWVVERVAGMRFADLMSERLWLPLGAERPASVTLDPLGAPRTAGGISMCLRDLARIGQLVLDGGTCGGRQIVSGTWIRDLAEGGDPDAWTQGNFADSYPDLDMRYRSQWYVAAGSRPLFFCSGIHGQTLFVDPATRTVAAKFASQDAPVDDRNKMLTRACILAIGRSLAS